MGTRKDIRVYSQGDGEVDPNENESAAKKARVAQKK